MADYEALELLAFAAVTTGEDHEYSLRHIFRWYSEHFHTPLHVLPDLPLDDILEHWFERRFEEMKDVERDHERERLLETREQRERRERQEEAERVADDDFMRVMNAEAQEKARKEAEAKPGGIVGVAKDAPPPKSRFTSMTDQAQAALPISKKLPANIRVTFLGDDEMDRLSDTDGVVVPPRPPR